MAHLDHDVRGHKVLCPHDDADAQRAERDGEQDALDLCLATEDVQAEQRQPGETGDPEQPDDEPFGPRAALPHRCPRRPIQRATRRSPTPYAIHATYPSATGPAPPTGCPPGAASSRRNAR